MHFIGRNQRGGAEASAYIKLPLFKFLRVTNKCHTYSVFAYTLTIHTHTQTHTHTHTHIHTYIHKGQDIIQHKMDNILNNDENDNENDNENNDVHHHHHYQRSHRVILLNVCTLVQTLIGWISF